MEFCKKKKKKKDCTFKGNPLPAALYNVRRHENISVQKLPNNNHNSIPSQTVKKLRISFGEELKCSLLAARKALSCLNLRDAEGSTI